MLRYLYIRKRSLWEKKGRESEDFLQHSQVNSLVGVLSCIVESYLVVVRNCNYDWDVQP
jgi:hypothetical protein